MKNRFFLAGLLAMSLFVSVSAQSGNNYVKGEGELVKQEISLSAIDGIQLSIAADVILTQGSSQMVIIEAQQNVIDNIKKEVRNGSWNIEFDKNVKNAKDVTIHITMASIEDIVLSGSGSITTKEKFKDLDDVDIAMSGSGEIKFEADAEEVDLAMSGSGNVNLSGTGESLNIAISGSGDVNALSFSAEECAVAVSGSGDVAVQVSGELNVAVSGSGDVKYKGDAKVQSRIVGSGDVVKI